MLPTGTSLKLIVQAVAVAVDVAVAVLDWGVWVAVTIGVVVHSGEPPAPPQSIVALACGVLVLVLVAVGGTEVLVGGTVVLVVVGGTVVLVGGTGVLDGTAVLLGPAVGVVSGQFDVTLTFTVVGMA